MIYNALNILLMLSFYWGGIMPKTFALDEIKAQIGNEIGVSDWLTIDQKRIDTFAECTEDHQWIHVDANKAAQGPFGKTIAHGFLSLSLITHLSEELMPIPEGALMVINYGMDKVRFLHPVPVDSEIRDRMLLKDVVEKGVGRILLVTEHTIEIKGIDKPAAVITLLFMCFTAAG
jgi:acyl dehydratase